MGETRDVLSFPIPLDVFFSKAFRQCFDHHEIVACIVCYDIIKFFYNVIFMKNFQNNGGEIDSSMSIFKQLEHKKWLVERVKVVNKVRCNCCG